MRTLREVIQDAKARKVAVGHFNVSDSNQLKAIADVARELSVPVMIGVSEGERVWVGVRQVAALIQVYKDAGQEIYLNADHTKTLEGIKEAIDAGFDEVLFDGTELSVEENTKQAIEAVKLARGSGRDVMVEGELGYIGASSKLLDAIPENAGLEKTDPEVAAKFVQETGIDLLAPSVGNIHGMLKSLPDPRLDVERVGAVCAKTNLPLVLHGASGNSAEDIAGCIKNGVAVVHINTEIRAAYRKGIQAALEGNPDEVAPYKFLGGGVEVMKKVVTEKLKLFNNL